MKKPHVLKRRMVCGDDAKRTAKQHVVPCADCPFARTAMPGWLGDMGIAEWIMAVHGESLIDCHVTTNQQCAGAAIFRANVFKSPRDNKLLVLEPNHKLVFSNDAEFGKHHLCIHK